MQRVWTNFRTQAAPLSALSGLHDVRRSTDYATKPVDAAGTGADSMDGILIRLVVGEFPRMAPTRSG